MTNFAKIAAVTAGSFLRADGGFTCLPDGAVVKVEENHQDRFYIPCGDGKHFLDGQSEGDIYIGLYPATEKEFRNYRLAERQRLNGSGYAGKASH